MDVYLLRHAKSVFNANPEDDPFDCPLTSHGIEQSTNLDFSSCPSHYSLIICSPLRRCLDTLKYSKITSDQFQINDLFREIRSGCQSDLLDENETVKVENEQEIEQRVSQIKSYLLELKERNIPNVLIVSHADLIWHFTSHQVNGESFGQWLKNAELFHWKSM